MTDQAVLSGAVEALYQVFEAYPLRPSTFPCTHCHPPEQESRLRSKPLRKLTAEDLSAYAASAMTTWGDEVDFKHFLPRIFEIAATGGFDGWPDLEVVYATLRYASWRSWPLQEQRAVHAYLLAMWRATIAMFPSPHGVGEVLCAIAQSVEDLSPFLNAWCEVQGDAPARHLAELLWSDGAHLIKSGSLANAFWSSAQRTQQAQIRDWLGRSEVHDWLERAFFGATSDAAAEALSIAVMIQEGLR